MAVHPVKRKPVFGVCDEVRLKPACSATETSQGLEILDIASIDIILSKQRITKALIRLRGCRFSHDVAHITSKVLKFAACLKDYAQRKCNFIYLLNVKHVNKRHKVLKRTI